MAEEICGNCAYCIVDDGTPYCCLKDLFTNVKLNNRCDEKDCKGRLFFTTGEHIKGEVVLGGTK